MKSISLCLFLIFFSVNSLIAQRVGNTTLTFSDQQPLPSGFTTENALANLTFSAPLCLRSPANETNRIFVVEKGGVIWEIADLQSPAKTLFLNLNTFLNGVPNESLYTSGEQGLLSMAFHPNFGLTNATGENDFFVFYTVNRSGARYDRISRFTVTSSGAPYTFTEQPLLDQRDQASNHNGGDIHFGPDGYLYVSLGDEGGSNDNYQNSQRLDKDYFAGVIRIDVDKLPGNVEPNAHPAVILDGANNAYYSVPSDNPFIGATSFNGSSVNPSDVITEFWAVGLRNPWRMSFDSVTGDLWLADVGQGAREEVDIITKGGNYGWYYREGFIQRPGSGTPPAGFSSIDPVHDYPRSDGSSITGGVVYRGTKIPSLYGHYIFGDFNSGNIWSLDYNGVSASRQYLFNDSGIAAYGVDPSNGDVLLCDLYSGQVKRLIAVSNPGNTFPATLTDTGAFADLTTLTPNPGVIAYQPILDFWSDNAIKSRWFSIPDVNDTMTFSANDPWAFPTGTVWVKHFDLEMERGNPLTKRRVETRFIIKTDVGAYGLSYKWNALETEATLADEAGENIDYIITTTNGPENQTWRIPSRNECVQCHTPAAGYALSFNTRQLNHTQNILGSAQNTIEALDNAGYLSQSPPNVNSLAKFAAMDDVSASLQHRARSYLAVNCAQCHQPGGNALGEFDLRAHLTLEDTKLLTAVPRDDGGDANKEIVVPGQVSNSILLHRLGATGGFTRMPPLASNLLDDTAIQLVTDWINALPSTYQSYGAWSQANISDGDAEPEDDKDKDGRTNYFEYLTQTDPSDPVSYWSFSIVNVGDQISLNYNTVPNTPLLFETSSNLVDWVHWNVTGNTVEFPANSSAASASGTREQDTQFLRARFLEP